MTSTDSNISTENETTETKAAPAKGTWQEPLAKSATLFDRSGAARKSASNLLWQGAKSGITAWEPESKNDVSAEGLHSEVLELLGKSRKGDASKIRTVALAVKNNGLVLNLYPNLSKAYAEARRLTKTVAEEQEQDDAAEAVIAALAVPTSATTIEEAALILLSKGVDGAVVAILDALNGPAATHNEAAHRAFMRSVATEIAARVQAAKPKPVAKVAGPKAGATAGASASTASPKAQVQSGAAKAKPVAVQKDAAPVQKAQVQTKAKPVIPVKQVQTSAAPVIPAKKAAPVIKRPVKA